jgi:activating signal cointegrator 1
LKAISLYQPWASLVALGLKRVETRSWSTTYRGPLLIHAAERWDADQIAVRDLADRDLVDHGYVELPRNLPLGRVLAVCRLTGCSQVRQGSLTPEGIGLSSLEMAFGDYRPGRFGWSLEDVRPLAEPVPWRGMQGLWPVPDELAVLCGVRLEPEVSPNSGDPEREVICVMAR